jgi:3-phenylpropionate/trans-cinnamate dioxygenase ferredoxin reductase subunit
LRTRDIDIRTSCRVERLEGNGTVERAILSDGSVVPCDVVVIGVGVRPETALAESAGLKVENGIVVDEFLQTSAPGVFAGGDAARFYHPLYRASMRVEHWNVAGQHGVCAARNMAGQLVAFREVPDFFSDLFDLSIEWLGYVPAWDHIVFRRTEPEKFSAYYLKDSRIAGALFVNNGAEIPTTRTLIERRTVFHKPEALANMGLDVLRAGGTES